MKFNSRKDVFFPILIFGISVLFIIMRLIKPINNGFFKITDMVFLLIIAFVVWIHYSTKYEITQTELKYKSGFIKGSIKIQNIKEIVKGKTLWVGIKPATATKGLIVKFDKYDEIYISPKTNDSFIKKIMEINPNIKITT